MNQKLIETISGVVADLAVKSTRTGRSMITFTLGGKNCKAFDNAASILQGLNGEQIELQVTRGSYMGKHEYCVVAVCGANSSTVKDTSRTNLMAAPAPGMERWNIRPGERASFRKLVVDYGDPELIAKFDALPWPDAPSEQMHQFLKDWRARPNKRKTQLQDHARSLGFSEDEIKQADKLFSDADKGENSIMDHLHLNREMKEIEKSQRERNSLSNQRIPDASDCLMPRKEPALDLRVQEDGRIVDGKEASTAPMRSAPIEPVTAKEPIGLKTDLAVKEPPAPLSHVPPAQAPFHSDDFVSVKGVTFEDLENQYKSQKMAREMEKLSQPGQPSE